MAEFDLLALYAVVESKKSRLGLDWDELAAELSLDVSVFNLLADQRFPGEAAILTLLDWMELPLRTFTGGGDPVARERTLQAIADYLGPSGPQPDRAGFPASALGGEEGVEVGR